MATTGSEYNPILSTPPTAKWQCTNWSVIHIKRSYCRFPIPSQCHHPPFLLIKTGFNFLESHKSLLHSPPSQPPPPTPPPVLPRPSLPSSPLSNSVHAVQGAHGLDGRPGPVVSGSHPIPRTPRTQPHPCPLQTPLFFFHSLYCLAACLPVCMSVHLPCLQLGLSESLFAGKSVWLYGHTL